MLKTESSQGLAFKKSSSLMRSPVVQAEIDEQQVEQQRLEILRSYNILDSPNEPKFDNLTRLAARLFDAPIVLISLVDKDRIWFKSHYGLGLEQIGRDERIFREATRQNEGVFVVPDATLDERFAQSQFVTGEPNLRFFAAAPLIVANDVYIGTFCIIDTKPRHFSAEERDALTDFATLCVSKITRHRNETIYRSLIENGSELILIFQEDGTVMYESPSVERQLGYPATTFLGAPIFHLIHPEDREYVMQSFYKTVVDPTLSYNINFRFLHKNGYYVHLEAIGHNRISDSAISGIVVNARDVTERVRMNEKLRESESRFKTAFEQSSLGIALVSTEGKWLRINSAICDMLGYSEEELQNLDFQTITHPDDLDGDMELVQQTLNGKITSYSLEKRYCHKDNYYIWCELNVSLVRDLEDKPSYFISQIQNITARKQQEERLRLLESVAVNATDAVLITEAQSEESPSPKIIYANRAMSAMTGYEESEVIGKTPFMFQGSQTSEATMRYVKAKMAECSPYTVELINYRKDGTPFWVEASFTPISDEKGIHTHWVGLGRDITARKNDERLLEEARLEAERANTAKSEFLSRMSHEFRTPLNAILGFAQLLETTPLEKKDRESVGYILHAGQHLLELVNEVLDISRIESGHLRLQIEPIKIADVTKEILEWVRPLAAQKEIKIDFSEAQNQLLNSSVSIEADAQRLRQVLLNLLSNALKFNRAGGSITLGSSEIVRDGCAFATLSITDTGFGITAQQSELLFQPFERLSAERDGIEGSGIGLTLSKQLAQAMGGDLKFHSTPGVGSTFWIELPVSGSLTNTKDDNQL